MTTREYTIALIWTKDNAVFSQQVVYCDNDAEALRTATALVRFLELNGATDAKGSVRGAGCREVGTVAQQDGVRVLATRGAEFTELRNAI